MRIKNLSSRLPIKWQSLDLNPGLRTASSPLPAAIQCSFLCSQLSLTIANRRASSGMWLRMNFSKFMVRASYVFGSCLWMAIVSSFLSCRFCICFSNGPVHCHLQSGDLKNTASASPPYYSIQLGFLKENSGCCG